MRRAEAEIRFLEQFETTVVQICKAKHRIGMRVKKVQLELGSGTSKEL